WGSGGGKRDLGLSLGGAPEAGNKVEKHFSLSGKHFAGISSANISFILLGFWQSMSGEQFSICLL
ncbi:hypothetical protein QQP08_018968, partial [Theobroma cacao]